MDCGSTILIFLAFIQATCGQPVTLTGPPDGAMEQESDTVYTCTGGEAPYLFTWIDLSVGSGVNIFLGGEVAYDPVLSPKYANFDVAENGDTSTMTITNTVIEDEGQYGCLELPTGTGKNADEELTVEVKSTRSLSVESTIQNNIAMYVATCQAVGGRPVETITWMLGDDPSPCDDLKTEPTAGSGLFNETSVCTFQATSENNGQTLKCVISGHQLSDLNGEETFTLPMHNAPSADIMTVELQFFNTSQEVRVSCNISDGDQPIPRIRNYYIYSDGIQNLIQKSSTGVNFVDVQQSEFSPGFEFNCVAGNYLGNTTTYDPPSTTAPPTTDPITTEGNTTTTPGVSTTPPSMTDINGLPDPTSTEDSTANTLGAGAIAGIAIGVIACIVIIVVIVLFLLKPECCPCFAGSGTKSSGSSKPAGSAVGSSNGSERDVESPLNGVKDVTAEEKLPQAAPRGHGSIQHTNDNPDQAMYAMVDKKKPSGGGGGDAPDTRGSGPGQNEPGSMLYADLDLSHKAGHTDKHVPKNENDVVVYSSILV